MTTPAETITREITVEAFTKSNVKTEDADSIPEAVEIVKKYESNVRIEDTKILFDDEVIYYSRRNGDIELWEKEWERQKRKMTLDESARDCPYENTCYENDLCMDCRLDKAADAAAE